MSVVNDVTRFVDGCVQGVEYFYNCRFDRDALDFSRFTAHLRFFAQRVFQGKQEQENDTHDEVFRALIARNCSEHYKCACCIAEYVRNTWHKELSDEELVFLTSPSETDSDGEVSFLASPLILHRSFLCGYICWIRT